MSTENLGTSLSAAAVRLTVGAETTDIKSSLYCEELKKGRPTPAAGQTHVSQCPLRIAFADGSRWTLIGTDEPSALVVSELGRVMRLLPGAAGRELYAVGSRDRCHDPQKLSQDDAAVCWLSPLRDWSLQIIQMEKTAKLLALESLPRGGLLLHCALAEYKGAGYVMAGTSGVGKSTASNRLPPPHRSLCDDRTLVVRDRTGRYWAHPWPTWSLLHDGKPDCSWPVESAVPLQGMFFLGQSASVRLQPTGRTQATALIMESAFDLAWAMARLSEAGESVRLWEDHLAAAKALAAAVPVFMLETSIQGRFWEKIEEVLPDAGEPEVHRPGTRERRASLDLPGADARNSVSSPPGAVDGRLRAICLGTAMRPTLVEADILEVEPYGRRRVRPGDVVCFKSPQNGETCVRRAISVSPPSPVPGPVKDGRWRTEDGGTCEEIRTRGDNSETNDPRLLRSEDIAGRVVAARRGSRRRRISGGLWGRVTAFLLRGLHPLRTFGRRLQLFLRDVAARLGPLDWLLPQHLRPRVLEFNGRHWLQLKLLLAGREIGRYNRCLRIWRVQRPFRLFVNPRRLPRPSLWSRASFAGVRFQPARTREENDTMTAPETVSAAACGDSIRSEPTGLSGSTRRLGRANHAHSTTVEEAAIEFVTGEAEKNPKEVRYG